MRAHHITLVVFIAALAVAGRVFADPSPAEIRGAAAKGLTILQKGAAGYMAQKKCFSCQHQALPVLGMTTAKARGFEIGEQELDRQVKFTAAFVSTNRENYEKGQGQGGQADTAGYALLTLHAGGWKADDTTDAV